MRDLTPFAVGLLVLLSGCATTSSGRVAEGASTADIASTGVTLSTVSGATELNPLALPLVPFRYGLARRLEERPCIQRRSGHAILSATGAGAAGNNLLVLSGAAFPPLGLLAAVPAYYLVRSRPCKPVLADEDIVLLGKWRDAYQRGDVAALRRITDNEKLVSDYKALFERTQSREVVYSDLESVRGGFFASYDVTFGYAGGKTEESRGRLKFGVSGGKIVAVNWEG